MKGHNTNSLLVPVKQSYLRQELWQCVTVCQCTRDVCFESGGGCLWITCYSISNCMCFYPKSHTATLYCLTCICFLSVYTVYFILDFILYTNFANQFIIGFEINYKIFWIYFKTFSFLLYGLMMAINVAKTCGCWHCCIECCVDGSFVDFIHRLTTDWSEIHIFKLHNCISVLSGNILLAQRNRAVTHIFSFGG